MIPRTLVAEALKVAPDSLPPGDLPLPRLAERFLTYLRAAFTAEAPADHPEFWTFMLFSQIAETRPELGLDIVIAAIDLCATPEDITLVVGGPLEDLASGADPALIARLEELAASRPQLRAALSGG